MNKPWLTPEGKKIWKTEAQYWGWLRGAIRRIWADYPLRKEWKARKLRPITQEEKDSKKFHQSTKNLGQCHYCEEWFAGSKLECDHLESSDGCTNKVEAESFLWYCGNGVGDEWVLACKPCHKNKTHSERRGISMQDASYEKIAIDLEKKKLVSVWLKEKGVTPASNAKLRRQQIIDLLREEKENVG